MINPQLRSLAKWQLAFGHRIVWQFWMSILLLFVFIIIGVRGNAEDPRTNYPETHKALLALIPPPIPPAENAAHVYRKAFAAVVAPTSPTLFPENNTTRESAYFENPELLAYVDSLAQYYSLLDDATAMPKCNWELEYERGFFMPMNHFSGMRNAARLLVIRARVRAHSGDHAGAALDLKRIQKMTEHMSSDKMLLNTLVIISIRAIRNAALQRILLFDTPQTVNEIQAYRDALKQSSQESVAHMFEGEFAVQAEMLDRMAMPNDANSALLKQNIGVPTESMLFLGLIYGSERKTLRALSQNVLSQLRSGNLKIDDQDMFCRSQKGPSFLVSMTTPAYSRAIESFERDVSNRLCADTALAVLLFRAKHSRDPKSLDELVPEFVPSVPVDSFNKKPMTMLLESKELELDSKFDVPKQTLPPGALRVYSWGKNGLDNRGHSQYSLVKNESKRVDCDDDVIFLPPIKNK